MLAERSEDHAILRANPHWAGARGNVRELRYTFGLTQDEALAAWKSGRFDLLPAFGPGFLDCPDTLSELIPGLGTHYLAFRSDIPPFANELVRKAFSHAVDRERLVAEIQPLARAAVRGGAIPPAMPGHSHRVAPEYDLELARKLLADAGYPDGKGLPELTMKLPYWQENTEVFAELWRPLGARVTVERTDETAYYCRPDGAHLWFSGWTVDFPDPDGFFRGLFEHVDKGFYVDDELRELVARARAIRNQGERMRLYHEIDRIWIAERAGILPLFYGRVLLVRRPWIENLWANPMSGAYLDQVVVNRPPAAGDDDPAATDSVPIRA